MQAHPMEGPPRYRWQLEAASTHGRTREEPLQVVPAASLQVTQVKPGIRHGLVSEINAVVVEATKCWLICYKASVIEILKTFFFTSVSAKCVPSVVWNTELCTWTAWVPVLAPTLVSFMTLRKLHQIASTHAPVSSPVKRR